MKKKLFLTSFILMWAVITQAQWQPDVRLTIDPAHSWNPSVSVSSTVVHAVWEDEGDGNWEIYYKRSSDEGLNWGADTRLTVNSAESRFPSISISGPVVHVVWTDYRDGNDEIYYKRSINEGISWGDDTRLTNAPSSSYHPSVSVSGSVVHVVWTDERDGNREIYYKRSSDEGTSWEADIRLTNQNAWSQYPSVSVSGSVVHVVWNDDRDGNFEIYYKRSIDEGISWGADTRLTNAPSNSYNPSVSVSGLVVHVVWHDFRNGGSPEIYYKRSIDGGVNWGVDTRLTNNPFDSNNPSVSVSGLAVHVVFSSWRDGNSEIYYKRSIDGGVNWGADIRLTNNFAGSFSSSVSVSGPIVHVVWHDERDGNAEIYYKRDPTGNPIGIINISSEIPNEFSLGQNYPNPFNPVTNIKFDIPKSSMVKITIYDILGSGVSMPVEMRLEPGRYQLKYDASNLSSGTYFYRLYADGEGQKFSKTLKLVLIK